MDLSQLQAASKQYPKSPDFTPSYGTAGFRAAAALLPSTVFRCGALMAARSLKTDGVTGLVVTASHNPEADNGVKLVDPTGYMLCQEWEVYADRLANAVDPDDVLAELQKLQDSECIPSGHAEVMIAHDTRQSAAELVGAARCGVEAVGGAAVLCGLLTTPQLHWMVRQRHLGLPCSEESYFSSFLRAYEGLLRGHAASEAQVLIIDCANGVGGGKLQQLQPQLAQLGLELDLRNCGRGVLNEGCGADFVQKDRQLPLECDGVGSAARCAGLRLFDGDKIAALAALFIQSLLEGLQGPSVQIGVIQTAYANGSSTQYLRDTLGCQVVITPTGVKHLHEEAVKFDIGIYFEANGHGTVLFSPDLLQRLRKLQANEPAARDLLALADLVNQAVGDAISGILLVEVALQRLNMTMAAWGSLYADLPSRQLKVTVEDRSIVTTTDAETRAMTPDGLQESLDQAVQRTPSGRAFVRPSGTEDVVRVYAEASTQEGADLLAKTVARVVYRTASGVGPAP
ncbi:hypothetical protein WJX72_002994 [[Myrmecia] bisecta]|uniref:phosphoacetylglucosamine mutase n=1 Tax=[Myrmecia] bisecta TaxID=41462 RepID=A0AAW1PIB0_9CHLO